MSRTFRRQPEDDFGYKRLKSLKRQANKKLHRKQKAELRRTIELQHKIPKINMKDEEQNVWNASKI